MTIYYYLRKVKLNKYIFVFLVVGLTFLSCQKRNHVVMTYMATQCADPWGSTSDNNLRNNISNYLAQQGVKVLQLDLRNEENILVCSACPCYSGVEIIVTVDNSDISTMIDHGFRVREE